MPLFMDIHTVDSDDFTVEDVVKAHMKDLAIQERFGVTQIKYWVNVEAKTLFCLMEGPDKDACNDVHKESHGNTACNIIEVSDDEFNLFMGQGKSVNDLAYTNSGEIDTGYRTVLLISMADFMCPDNRHIKEIQSLIEKHNGTQIIQPDEEIMVSFVDSSDSLICASRINDLLKCIPDTIEFTITLVSGRPVDEQGENLFEETKKKLQYLALLGLRQTIYLDYETKAIAEKDHSSTKVSQDIFRVIENEDFMFMKQLIEILENNIRSPEFKSDDLNPLLGSSKSQTYRKLKLLTDLAPNQLIQEVRLRKSLKNLKKKNSTIADVAYDLGFNSPTYFTRIFKKRFHITPTYYNRISQHN